MKKSIAKKLVLKRETVRTLADKQLARVGGGAEDTGWCKPEPAETDLTCPSFAGVSCKDCDGFRPRRIVKL